MYNFFRKNIQYLRIKKYYKSGFVKGVATLTSGAFLAQLISISTAPILYRIYDKVDYGLLGTYMAVASITTVFSSFQFGQLILLMATDEDARKAIWINRYINIFFSIIIFGLTFFLNEKLSNLLNTSNLSNWLLLLPFSIFFTGQNEISRIWINRKGQYKILATNSLISAVSIPVISITIGYFKQGPAGLFIGLMISQILPFITLSLFMKRRYQLSNKNIRFSELLAIAKANLSFPKYSIPTEFIHRLIEQMPVLLIGKYYGAALVGVYNLCMRMLSIPVGMLTNALGEVFKQRAALDFNEFGTCRNIFIKTLKLLTVFSILLLVFVSIFSKVLFTTFFGVEWEEAGFFAKILVWLVCFQLVVSPLTYVYIIARKLLENLLLHIYILLSSLVIFVIGFKLTTNFKYVIISYVINYCFVYLIYLFRSYKFSAK